MFETSVQPRNVGRLGLAGRTGGSFVVAASLVFYLLLLVSFLGATVSSTNHLPLMSGDGILSLIGVILAVPILTFVSSLPTFLASLGVFMVWRRQDSPRFAVVWGGISGVLFAGAAIFVLATHDPRSLLTSVSSGSVFATAVAALFVALPVDLGVSLWRRNRDA